MRGSSRGIFKKRIGTGVFHERVDPKAMAKIFIFLFEGAMIKVKTEGSTAPLEEFAKEAAKLLKDEWLYLFEVEE